MRCIRLNTVHTYTNTRSYTLWHTPCIALSTADAPAGPGAIIAGVVVGVLLVAAIIIVIIIIIIVVV